MGSPHDADDLRPPSEHDPDLPDPPRRRRGGGRPAGVPGLRVTRARVGSARRMGRIAGPDGPFVLAPGLAAPGDVPLADAMGLAAAEWRRQAAVGATEETTAYGVINHSKRFAKYAAAHGITTLGQVDQDVCELYVHSPNAAGYGGIRSDGRPSPATNSTKHGRRHYLRALFRTCRLLGLDDRHPAQDIVLPGRRDERTGRPATAEEVLRCQDASVTTTRESRLPCALALVLAGAHTSELPYVMPGDAFPDHGLVWAHGTGATTTARWLVLDDWGTEQVARRLDWLAAHPVVDDGTCDPRGLVYAPKSLGVPHHIRCGAGSAMMSEVIKRAGLADDPGFRPLSLQEHLAQQVYEQTGSVEKVAVRLGMRSLDSVADLLDLDWRDAHASAGPPGVRRTADDHARGRRRAAEDTS